MNKPLLFSLVLAISSHAQTPILEFKPDAELPDGTLAEVSGVTGATVKIVKQGFNPKAAVTETVPVQKVEILKEPSMGGVMFLRVTRDSAAQVCGIALTPVTTANSLAALSPLGGDGIPRPSGTIDAFVRCNSFVKSGDLALFDVGQHGGLRISIGSGQPSQGMVATLQALLPEKQIDSDLDGTPDTLQISAVGKDHPLQPDMIYHVAVTFDTAADGVITLKVYQKEGTGPILTSQNTDLVAKAQGRLTGKFEAGFPEAPIRLGIFGTGKKDHVAVQDFAALRLYQGIPATIPGLHD